MFSLTRSVRFETVFACCPNFENVSFSFCGLEFDALTTCCIFLLIGATGKSAQLGLHVWLPNAMEAPTPISALLHAATLVTAGVFLIARCSPIFEYAPFALLCVAFLGGMTALFAATTGIVQNDLKFNHLSEVEYYLLKLDKLMDQHNEMWYMGITKCLWGSYYAASDAIEYARECFNTGIEIIEEEEQTYYQSMILLNI